MWNELVDINSDLKVIEDELLINKEYCDYDEIILNTLSKLKKCSLTYLVTDLMSKFIIDDSGSAIYHYLIDRLIFQKKINIIEKGKKTF